MDSCGKHYFSRAGHLKVYIVVPFHEQMYYYSIITVCNIDLTILRITKDTIVNKCIIRNKCIVINKHVIINRCIIMDNYIIII